MSASSNPPAQRNVGDASHPAEQSTAQETLSSASVPTRREQAMLDRNARIVARRDKVTEQVAARREALAARNPNATKQLARFDRKIERRNKITDRFRA